MWLFLRFSACYALALILALGLLVTLMFFAQNDWMQLLIGSGKPLAPICCCRSCPKPSGTA